MMKPNSIFCEKVNRKLGLLVVIFFLIMKGFSQVPFEKAYTTIPNPGWMVYQSITHIEKISTTGAFYGVGNLNPTAGGYTNEWSLNLWKLDAYGDTIWVKTLPQSDPGSFWIAVDASLRSDGSMYVLYRQYNPGYDFNGVLLVNASGNIEWNTPITSQGEYAQGRLTQISTTPDGGSIICGSTSYTPSLPYVVKLSATGSIEWSSTSFPNDPSYARFTHPTSDGIFRAPRLFLPENNAENQPTSLTLKINAPFTIHNFSSYWYQLSIDSNFNGELINQVVDLDTILWIATCIPMANGLDFQQLQYSPSHPDPPK